MFIGREAELGFLEDCYTAPGGQLVIFYGRRRVGKTATLRQFCQGKPYVYFTCRECSDAQQLRDFSRLLLGHDIATRKYLQEFSSWESAFRAVLELPESAGKRLVVIDEFPYMCRGNKSIPSILQSLWDEVLRESQTMIVLCGSSMSFMEKEILAEKNPLYGRATGIYRLKPMGFSEARLFFPNYSARDQVMAYAVLGGMPHYLAQFDPQRSLEENIKRQILRKGCALYSEVEFAVKQELREPHIYNSLLEAVAVGCRRLNEISQRSLLNDSAKACIYLKHLEELGLVEREFSLDAGKKERATASRGLYWLADNYFRFWYAFLFANLSALDDGDVDGVYEHVLAPNLHRFASLAFEEVCREYVKLRQKHGTLPFRYAALGRWFGKTTVRGAAGLAETELDLLARTAAGDKYLVGECKFKGSPFSYGEYLDVKAKLAPEQERAEFHYMLFSEAGFAPALREAVQGERVELVELEDMF